MSTAQKDTVYIDVDDEITTIVDKIQDSSAKVVALVLPKRAAALQSIVNMKLLKRSAEENDKTVVLITSEAGLLPLAGAVGIYTAKNLQTKPEIPPAPVIKDEKEAVAEVPEDAPIDTEKSVGELAGASAVEDSVEIADKTEKPAKQAKAKKQKAPKKIKYQILRSFGLSYCWA